MTKRILLRFVHGLGDTVQLGVVLKHLARHRPDWVVDVVAGRGKHTALEGLCNRVYHDQEPDPRGPYDSEHTLGWYENYAGYQDRPNSKITNCLSEVFGLGWDKDLGSYEIRLSAEYRKKACDYLKSIGAKQLGPEKFAAVIVHYEGNTSTWKKNLKTWHARQILDLAIRAGRTPVLLDWDGRSPLPDNKTVFCPGVGPGDIWGGFGSGDAAMIAALVHCSEAFVGIDSGPGKCASATKTPVLIVWKEHHPIQFDDPNPTTTHLIPHDWRRIPPCERPGVAGFFERHYKFETYHGGEHGLAGSVRSWLAGVLGCGQLDEGHKGSVPFVLPRGIGDIAWALLKLRSVNKARGGGPIDIIAGGGPVNADVEKRSVPFLRRFGFIRSAEALDVPVLLEPNAAAEESGKWNDSLGRYRYVPDGERGGFHFLVPNTTLEAGKRIEEWLPEHPVDWDVVNEFSWENTEKGEELADAIDPFVAFYLGPEAGNVDEGHNRGFLWEPKHWVALARLFASNNLAVALVGAPYDRSYYERYCAEGFREAGIAPVDLIGKLEIGETFRFLKRAKAFISYQCGLAIWLHYLGGKVACWWRPEGDSCHPRRMVSFSEDMAHCWTNPRYKDRYIPLIYKRETPGDIYAECEKRGWLD